jgi:hypothetical protein
MSIEPGADQVRLLLSAPLVGTVLKARLPAAPAHPRSVIMLLEALAAWYRQPLHAVVAADDPGVTRDPELWALLLGDVPGLDVRIEWVARLAPKSRRDRFLGALGSFASGRRLLNHTATGQR